MYEVLNEKRLPVWEYNLVYGERITDDYAQGCNSFSYVKDYFLNHKCDIVLKPNDGTCGRDVYRVQDLNNLERLYDKLTKKYFSINMGPFYNIKNEYRFILLNNEVKMSYCKNKPFVYGDGKRTIRELLIDFNENFFRNRLNDSKYDRVLQPDEIFEYNWKFNLSQGAVASRIENEELYNKLKKIALDASSAVGMSFGSVDIIVTEDNNVLILEMNSGVMVDNYIEQFIDGYDKAKELYKDVIIEMFRN